MVAGWRISVDFIRRSHGWLAKGIKNKLIRRIAEGLVIMMADALENRVNGASKDLEWIKMEASKVNIRGLRGLMRSLISWNTA